MPKVYISNFSRTGDYSSVEDLGDFVYVTEGIILAPHAELHQTFRQAFSIAEEGDYLLLVGGLNVTSTAYHEWLRRFPNSANVITWDKRNKVYRSFTISAEG